MRPRDLNESAILFPFYPLSTREKQFYLFVAGFLQIFRAPSSLPSQRSLPIVREDSYGDRMAAEGETSNNAILRSLLELAAGGEEGAQQQLAASGGVSSENVAQLLAAAIAQVGQTILAGSSQPQGGGGSEREGGAEEEASQQTTSSSTENLPVNPLTAIPDASGNGGVFDLREAYESVPQASTLDNVVPDDTDVVSTVEIAAASEKPRPLCVKFPLELRRRIISTRKSGKLCKDIAKELKVSVSGVQKVWERFLATGMAHDRKPSTYAGRPRKSTYSQVCL